jgi:ABC-type transport system involved in multi-copper enzyme maturation permease subunit
MKILAIAINTFREAVRDKILYSLLIFALFMILSSTFISTLTVGEQIKIIKDMGLSMISIFGTLIAVFVGIGLVFKELEKRTIYTIIAKPIMRYQFLLGKYCGLVLTLLVEVAVMAGSFLLLLLYYPGAFDKALFKAIYLIFLELMLITSVALLFSSFSTPILSGIMTLSFFIIGHLTYDLKLLVEESKMQGLEYFSNFLYYTLPNLENFNIKGRVIHHLLVDWNYMFFTTLYGLFYISLLLSISIIIFQRRDFK